MNPNASEEEFRKALVDYAMLLGYMHFHPRPCRVNRDGQETYETAYDGFKGYPDETFVHERNGYTILAELKSKSGKLDPFQHRWADALAKGPTPYYLWRPKDWEQCLAVLEAGARGEPRDHASQGSQQVVKPKATDDPHYRHAERTVTAWWEYHKGHNDGKPPTAMNFVAVVKVVQKLYKAGWAEIDVKRALLDTTVVSVGAMEFARNKLRQREGRAVNEMSVEEWRQRTAGKPLTERPPRPEPPDPAKDQIIDVESTEVSP